MKRTAIIITSLLILFSLSGYAQNKGSVPPKKKWSLKEKIYFGGYLGLQFGSYTSVDVSPLIGYRINPNFNVGVGVLYTYTSFNYGGVVGNHGYSSWGGRLTANYTLFNLLTLGAEYQYRTVELLEGVDSEGNPIFNDKGVSVLFLGGGIRQRIGKNSFMYFLVYYDVLQDVNSPYDSVVFRVGASVGL